MATHSPVQPKSFFQDLAAITGSAEAASAVFSFLEKKEQPFLKTRAEDRIKMVSHPTLGIVFKDLVADIEQLFARNAALQARIRMNVDVMRDMKNQGSSTTLPDTLGNVNLVERVVELNRRIENQATTIQNMREENERLRSGKS
jgi:cell division protein FtsB